jgi:hypothetical protein
MHKLQALMWRLEGVVAAAVRRAAGPGARDRGDVPGWVMVTVMSAILVVAIIGVFEPEIKGAITNAVESVSSTD